MREIFMSYCRHEMTLKALKECKWLGDLDDESEEVIAECARLQKYIIELADEFGCEITNKEDVIKSIEDEKSNLLANFYKSRDGEYYYEMELAEPASDYLNNMALNQEYVEKNYINMDEVYWYFEKKDIEGGWIKYDDRRHTYKEIRETLAKSGFLENVYPIYAIGFKLP